MADITRLVDGWRSHFWAADHEIEWLKAEWEGQLWLDSRTLLLGRVDAIGRAVAGQFFGEWKTSNGRDRNTWKATWRMNPQSLTYGVLVQSQFPECRRFCVRKAFKTEPPSYDYAWFEYSEAELLQWHAELRDIAEDVRRHKRRAIIPWQPNWDSCFKYGPKYPCEFFERGCSRLDFQALPPHAEPRISHLDTERALDKSDPELVVLDATRVRAWFECREAFRRTYVENMTVPPGEALRDGIQFHDLVGKYYQSLIKEQ